MEFDKYRKKGAYHWDQYEEGTVYTEHVKKMIAWVRPGRTLDVGAGDGCITFFLDADGIDNDQLAVSLAKERNARVELGSAYELKGEYDNVVLSDVLEHLQYPELALVQIKKVLKKDGRVYVVAPPPVPGRKGPRRYHYQEWNASQLVNFMFANGFICEDIKTISEWKRIYGVFKLKDD
jgi:SAM-dependent methyltransferase